MKALIKGVKPVPCHVCRKAGLLMASVLLSLLLAEALLRGLDIDVVPAELALYRALPGGGFVLRTGLDVDVRFNGKVQNIHINSLGQRWPEPTSNGVGPHIALVGDSFLFGLWADSVNDGMAAVFHRELGRDKYVVTNYAVPGYGFADIELQLPDILKSNPDYLLLVSYNGNDLLDTWLGPARYRVSNAGVLRLDHELLARHVPASMRDDGFQFREKVLEWSRLLRLAQMSWRRFSPPPVAVKPTAVVDTDTGFGSDRFWSRRIYPPFAVEARQATVQSLTRIAAFCKLHNIRLLIASVPYREQVYASDGFGTAYDVALPQSIIGDFANAHSVPWLDLQPSLAAHYREHRGYLHHLADGHFNNRGHEVTGKELAQFFRLYLISGLPPSPAPERQTQHH